MRYREPVIKELFGSASWCAFPGCWERLIAEDRGVSIVNVDIAHIRSKSPRGPRYDEKYPGESIDEARNLLLLCMKHHRLADASDSTYTVAELESWKRDQVAGWIGGALPDGRAEEIFRFFERFADHVADDLDFDRWQPDTDESKTSSSEGGTAGFALVADDPVSVSAAWSVAQLLDGFAPDAVVCPQSAEAFGAAVAAFLLDGMSGFTRQVGKLEHCCRTDPFEAMLTSVVFGVTAARLWETVAGQPVGLLCDVWVAAGLTIPYVADIVIAAFYGRTDHDPLPGHPSDQRKVAMNLGKVTAMTLQLTADRQNNPMVSVVQDLLIGVQRLPLPSSRSAN
ncbi:HNH endonuclease [Amycolatopsis sp. CB00013]|uniref:HNH endonuclease n=1 Tax=Amycolatopsis sp. CB00013 TaxID=1703945 RepID=UPI001160F719|nr:HNH endonuclease [Amycolatopsis sp. CB00013]